MALDQWRGGIFEWDKAQDFLTDSTLEFASMESKAHIHTSVAAAWHPCRLDLTE